VKWHPHDPASWGPHSSSIQRPKASELFILSRSSVQKIFQYRENKGKSTGKDFLNRTPTAQEIRSKIDQCDCIKLKSFLTVKETITKMKRHPTERDKIC
jgi:hypothetical protein